MGEREKGGRTETAETRCRDREHSADMRGSRWSKSDGRTRAGTWKKRGNERIKAEKALSL